MGKYRGAAPGCGIISLKCLTVMEMEVRMTCFGLFGGFGKQAAVQDPGGKYFCGELPVIKKKPCQASGKCGAAVG